jgi:hypothetical protein
MRVFIDDSGDPGFRLDKGSSPFFVIALVIFDDDLDAERTSLRIKETRRELNLSDSYEFKFNKSNKNIKMTFIDKVTIFNFRIRAIVVDKNKIISPRFHSEKEDFYNFVIMQVLKNNNGKLKKAKLYFDSRGERAIRDQLRVYLSRELDNKTKKIFRELKFENSKNNTLIQLADMVAGSIYAYYTNKDKYYLEQLQRHNKVEDLWDFK